MSAPILGDPSRSAADPHPAHSDLKREAPRMPSTLIGLLVAVCALIPGYCYYAIRRRTVLTRLVSTVIEGANLLVVAVVTNTVTMALYGVLQWVPWFGDHSPSIVEILRDPRGYVLASNARLAYVGAWAMGALAVSSMFAVAFARRLWPIERLAARFVPGLSDESVWHRYFERQRPKDIATYPYLECHLIDGSYVAGPLVWYNTDIEDHPDRELVIGQPLTILGSDGEPLTPSPSSQAILPAREIRRILVTHVELGTDTEQDATRPGQ